MFDHISVDLGEDFLAHYGVKGMHWGIRKDPVPNANSMKEISKAVRGNPNKKELTRRLNDATVYAMENPDNFLAVRQSRNITVLTGSEFTDSILQANGYLSLSNITPITINGRPG